jgi:hypothetical protein
VTNSGSALARTERRWRFVHRTLFAVSVICGGLGLAATIAIGAMGFWPPLWGIPLALLLGPSLATIHRSWSSVVLAPDRLSVRGIFGRAKVFDRDQVRFVQVVETSSEDLEKRFGTWFVQRRPAVRGASRLILVALRNFGRRTVPVSGSPSFSMGLSGLWIELVDGRRFEFYVPRDTRVHLGWIDAVHAWSPGHPPASVLAAAPGSPTMLTRSLG